jgi:hypothetical protein
MTTSPSARSRVPEQPFRLPRRDLPTALLNLRYGGRNRLNLELVIDICDQRHWPGMDVLRARSACRSVSLTRAYSALFDTLRESEG